MNQSEFIGGHVQVNGPEPKVSFVTVCFRTPHLIRLLLKGVEAAQFRFPYEFILVNNDPEDEETNRMVREKYPWVNLIVAPKNLGFGAGNNLGLRRMRGKYAMLTNPDLVFFSGEMEKLVDFLDTHPDIGLVGPALHNPDGTRQDSCYRFPSPIYPLYRRTFIGKTPWGKRANRHHLMQDQVSKNQIIEVDALMASAILVRKRALNDTGLFDERIFMYMEDFDIARRAWKFNWRVVYNPNSKLVHYHNRESRITWPWQLFTHKPARAHITSAVYYFWKYRGTKNPHNNIRPVL